MIPHEILPLFGDRWWLGNIPTVVGIVAVLWFARRLPKEQEARFAHVLGWLLLARYIFITPYQMIFAHWTIQDSLPLHLCGLNAILAGVVLLRPSQRLFEFVYYLGIPGAFHSLLTPEFTQGTVGLLFPDYFFAHGGILLSGLYLVLVRGMAPEEESWWRIVYRVQPLVAAVALVNLALDSNYMYLCKKPIVENPFVIGDWPWYVVGLYAAGFLHVVVLYLPFGLRRRRSRLQTVA